MNAPTRDGTERAITAQPNWLFATRRHGGKVYLPCRPDVLLGLPEEHRMIHRLRTNKALTPSDLAEPERMLASNGVGDPAAIQKATADSQGHGLFVRSLVGRDRGAAKEAR